jgi:hypothetical protein
MRTRVGQIADEMRYVDHGIAIQYAEFEIVKK